MCLLFASVFDVLNPEVYIAVELACSSVENEENASLAVETCRPNPKSLHPLLSQNVEVDFVFDISDKVHRLCATRVQLVLEVRSLLDD